MITSPAPKALRRMGQAKRTANLHAAVAMGVVLAYAALAAPAAAHAADKALPGSLVLAYSDEALPGEGRPPSPGPTEPDGPSN